MAVRLVYSPTSAYLLPAITTDSITSITDTMAVGCGYVMSDGGLTVTERGFCWSTNHNPTVNDSHALSGTGTGAFAVEMIGLMANTTYYVSAYAINNAGTSYGTEESFTTLESVGSDVPEGAINGLFSVDANRQVYFSQGNLQYRATTDTWQFAANQYDYVGSNNQYISSDFGGWIDLFGYGTSGCYPRYPWLSSTNPNSYSNYPYYGDIANTDYDWGAYNPISNGGNEAGLWRTLTKSEWVYLLVIRANASEKYSYAVIDGTAGIVLLPDNYTIPNGIFFNPNANNQYSVSEWQLMELNGAVFLPKAGSRTGTNVGGFNTDGYYWTSTGYEDQYNYHAYALFGTTPTYSCYKYVGCSVRLVQDYNP